MDERQQLLAAIEEFCEREGMAPTTFGRKALGDGRFGHLRWLKPHLGAGR